MEYIIHVYIHTLYIYIYMFVELLSSSSITNIQMGTCVEDYMRAPIEHGLFDPWNTTQTIASFKHQIGSNSI